MDYFPEVLIISLIGGLVSIDTASGWQVMISQPVVVCPILGLIFGHIEMGLSIGILLELPWLVNVPLGGFHGSEGNLGAVVATSLGIFLTTHKVDTPTNIIIIISILYSLIVSRVGSYTVEYVRKANLSLVYSADRAALEGDLGKITWLNIVGLIYSFLMGLSLVAIGFSVGIVILPPLAGYIHPEFDFAFGVARYGLIGLGIGAVATLFITKETKWFLVIPFVVGVLILGLILIFT